MEAIIAQVFTTQTLSSLTSSTHDVDWMIVDQNVHLPISIFQSQSTPFTWLGFI